MKIDYEAVIKAYDDGQSLNSIAKAFGTYPTSIKRILERQGVSLRHDVKKEGELYVKDGEKLIEWAKKQGRLVTKTELARVIGRKKLSPSYFIKYPELGQYVKGREQDELSFYHNKLYTWLKSNNIPYKASDRTKLGVQVDALLLGDYSGLAIQILVRPSCVSKKQHELRMKQKAERATKAGIIIIWLTSKKLVNLDLLLHELNDLKK